MKTIFAAIILFNLYHITVSQNMIHYDVSNIKCVDIFHKYNKHYTSPCKQWLREMNETNPPNTIKCITSVDGTTGRRMHGCTPAFGGKKDSIYVKYYFKKIDKSESCVLENPLVSEYDIRAEVGLKNPWHPSVVVSIMVIIVVLIIASCLCDDNHRNNHNDAFWGAYMGSIIGDSDYGSNDSWSWTYEE